MSTYTSLSPSLIRNLISPSTQYATNDGVVHDRPTTHIQFAFEHIAVFCTRMFCLLFVTFRWETDSKLHNSLWKEIKKTHYTGQNPVKVVDDLCKRLI